MVQIYFSFQYGTNCYRYSISCSYSQDPNTQSSKTHLLSLYPLFPSISSPRSLSMLHGWRIDDDDDVLEQSGQLGKPIATAHPDRVPPRRVGFRFSRDLTGMSYISCSWRGSSGDVSCILRSLLEAQDPDVDKNHRRQPTLTSTRP
jgi:hypothetical protein